MEKQYSLDIKNVSVAVFDKEIVKNLNLSVEVGSIHAIMGPNGSGKSSLAYALAGHPHYNVTSGSIIFNDQDLLALSACERAQKGLFLSFQNPPEIPGVSVFSFLKSAYSSVKKTHVSVEEFTKIVSDRCLQLTIQESFLARGLNEGFSGGEKKRFELLQLLLLQPNIVILDEIDSGLDIDALKDVAAGLNTARAENPSLTMVIITHYRRILDYIQPHFVHILCDGHIVTTGDYTLVNAVEAKGYDALRF